MLNRSSRWRAWICESAEESLIAAAFAAHPMEAGGILVGVHVGTRPWITHAVEVESPGGGPFRYELPAGARHTVVARMRRQDSRLGYVGEWHSHPADSGPSRKDIESLERIAADRTSGCPRPLLVVVRRARDRYRLDAGQLVRRLRAVRLVACGPLPPDDSHEDDRRSEN